MRKLFISLLMAGLLALLTLATAVPAFAENTGKGGNSSISGNQVPSGDPINVTNEDARGNLGTGNHPSHP